VSGNAGNASDRNLTNYPVTQQNVLRRDTGTSALRSDAVAVRSGVEAFIIVGNARSEERRVGEECM
jgi:hypothetical protein